MIRFFVVFLSLFAVHANALPKCRLDLPIPVKPEEILKTGLQLRDVKFDKAPRFAAPGSFDPKVDVLDLDLFNIRWNYEASNYLGASVGVRGKLERVGFSSTYIGDFHVEGNTTTVGDTLLFFTKHTTHFSGKPHAKPSALTLLRLQVKNGRLISLALEVPVYRIVKTSKGVEYLAYTGQQDALCLKSAK